MFRFPIDPFSVFEDDEYEDDLFAEDELEEEGFCQPYRGNSRSLLPLHDRIGNHLSILQSD